MRQADKAPKNNQTDNQMAWRSVGCVMRLPLVAVVLGFLMLIGWSFLQLYLFGMPEAFVSPFQDPTYLLAFLVILVAMAVVAQTAWRDVQGWRKIYRRWKGVQDEKQRIERLMAKDANTSVEFGMQSGHESPTQVESSKHG